MNKTAISLGLLMLAHAPSPVRADLYEAAAAVERKDLPGAFAKFRELAELGHPLAQETLAAMYVNGEGVARDNILGYAWAKLAVVHGDRPAARSIVAHIEPLLRDAQRARAAEIESQFGEAALRERLYPIGVDAGNAETDKSAGCKMRSAPDPDNYYPPEARRRDISGTAVVHAPVLADGSTRSPMVVASFPGQVFDFAARQIAFLSTYTKTSAQGEPCQLRFAVKFRVKSHAGKQLDQIADEIRPAAAQGDPLAQTSYGLLVATSFERRRGGERAWTWFLQAAQAGVASAQYMTGLYLLTGTEVQKDEGKALRWLDMAARNGSPEAHLLLGTHALRESGNPAMRARAVEHLSRATEAGNWQAKFYLASLLAEDTGAPWHEPKQALRLLAELQGGFDYDPAAFEIRAAAHAAMAEFADAKRFQKRAIDRARALKWDLAALDDRMRAYERHETTNRRLIPF